MQAQGISILFVSHKLDEVFEISERFTIFRNGENVQSGDTSELDSDKFTFYMTGRQFEKKHFEPKLKEGNPILEVKNLTLHNEFEDISFELRRGEVLAITGLLGSGRTELALALFGQKRPTSGQILIDGKPVRLGSVQDAMAHRIGYVPEDRLTEGLFLNQSIVSNISIAHIRKFANKFGLINFDERSKEVDELIRKLKIKVSDAKNPASTLSGGNQQRIVLAKWLATELDILILNGPTVGVDIGSKHDIHEILHELANNGLAIIIISDDLPEVITNSNRVLIMREGVIKGEFDPSEITEAELAAKVTEVAVN